MTWNDKYAEMNKLEINEAALNDLTSNGLEEVPTPGERKQMITQSAMDNEFRSSVFKSDLNQEQ